MGENEFQKKKKPNFIQKKSWMKLFICSDLGDGSE